MQAFEESYWTSVSMDDTIYKCGICGIHRKQKDKSGHGNLIGHLASDHPDIVKQLNGKQPTIEAFVSVKASQVYGWIDLMTLKDIPFSWSKPGETNQYLKLPTMDPRTIKNFMHKTGKEIERIVSTSIIRKKNGVIVPLVMLFDMWDDGNGTKQLGVFLCYPDKDFEQPVYFLLCCTPLIDETNSTGKNQVDTIELAMDSFNISWEDVMIIIADNTAVNPSISRRIRKPMIGCQSHVLNLAVKEYVKEHQPLLQKMNELCKTFRLAKNRGRLREAGCDTAPKMIGHKWEALYCMLQTYFDVVGRHIEELVRANPSNNYGNEHSFTPTERATLLRLKDDLAYFHSVSIALQSRDTNLYDVRILFDRLLKKFGNIEELHHLTDDDNIVHYEIFSKALVKLQSDKSHLLTEEEKLEMIPFLMLNDDANDEEDEGAESQSEDEDEADDRLSALYLKGKSKRQRIVYISQPNGFHVELAR